MPTKVFKKIRKRNGRLHKFNAAKIENAIRSAGRVTGEIDDKTAKRLTIKVVRLAQQLIEDGETPTVEEIQDVVEEVLLNSSYHKVAKEYILFREKREQIRNISANFNKDLINKYLKRKDWKINENSNMDFSLSGLNNYMSSEMSKTHWLYEIYPKEIRDAHLKGDMHIHDLSAISVYCMGWDLNDLLMSGFTGVVGKVESKPAKHFRVVLGQIVNFIYTLQNECSGAQAFSNFDTLLAPFIRYDKLSYKEVKQSMQEFIFNMNVSTRHGAQTPFSNLTLDLEPSPIYKDQRVIIGGKLRKEKYRDFQKEMDWLNKAFFEVMFDGDAKGRVFTFPIPTYNITSDFNWDNPNLNMLWSLTARYGIPYFSNFINSSMKPEDARSMCCRLRLDTKELASRGGGLFGANPLTGSIGVVTINMPKLAYNSATGVDFMKNLRSIMDQAKESLEIKRDVLEKFTDSSLYPYTKFYLRDVKKRFHKYWTNHFSTIGLVGMNEACLNLLGEDIASVKGRKFASKVLKFMRKRLLKYQQETGNNYNLEATPAEGTSYRLAIKDKEQNKDIICANEDQYKEGAEPFYTNSSQLPVTYTEDIFEALDLQDDLQTKYTGGTVMHLFLGEKVEDTECVKKLVKLICEKYHLPYFTLTPTFSICPKHGYINGEVNKCPKCEAACEIYSRVVGYLRPISQWNKGKQAEYKIRKVFKVPDEKKSEG